MVKFRSWITSTREFIYFENGNYTRLKATKSHVFNWQTAEQDTGVKDKNGIAIYEGDVVYLAGYGDYKVEFPFALLYEALVESDIGDIIGNIHENYELLEE